MMRRTILGVVTVLLTACGSSAAHSTTTGDTQTTAGGTSAGAASGAVCGPSRDRTLASSSSARVYVSGRDVYGCVRGAKGSRRLGQSSSCLGGSLISPVVVKGVLAAYGSQTCGVDTGTATVVVQRLSDGAVLAQRPASTAVIGPESHVRVTALVMDGDGDVAWIAASSSIIGSRHATQVRALDHRGARLLDHGNSVDSAQLHLRGAKVSWKHGASGRSATLY